LASPAYGNREPQQADAERVFRRNLMFSILKQDAR